VDMGVLYSERALQILSTIEKMASPLEVVEELNSSSHPYLQLLGGRDLVIRKRPRDEWDAPQGKENKIQRSKLLLAPSVSLTTPCLTTKPVKPREAGRTMAQILQLQRQKEEKELELQKINAILDAKENQDRTRSARQALQLGSLRRVRRPTSAPQLTAPEAKASAQPADAPAKPAFAFGAPAAPKPAPSLSETTLQENDSFGVSMSLDTPTITPKNGSFSFGSAAPAPASNGSFSFGSGSGKSDAGTAGSQPLQFGTKEAPEASTKSSAATSQPTSEPSLALDPTKAAFTVGPSATKDKPGKDLSFSFSADKPKSEPYTKKSKTKRGRDGGDEGEDPGAKGAAFSFGTKPSDNEAPFFTMGAKPAASETKPSTAASSFSFTSKPADGGEAKKPDVAAFSFGPPQSQDAPPAKKSDEASSSFSFSLGPKADDKKTADSSNFAFGPKKGGDSEQPKDTSFSFGPPKVDAAPVSAGGFSFSTVTAEASKEEEVGGKRARKAPEADLPFDPKQALAPLPAKLQGLVPLQAIPLPLPSPPATGHRLNPILLVLDVDGVLCDRGRSDRTSNRLLKSTYDFWWGNFMSRKRPHFDRFWKFLQQNAIEFQIMVWSSAMVDNVKQICDHYLQGCPLLDIWGREQCDKYWYNASEAEKAIKEHPSSRGNCRKKRKPQIAGVHYEATLKDLSRIWSRYSGQWNASNTLLIDDDPRKASRHPLNAIHPSAYDGETFDSLEEYENDTEFLHLIEYLKGCRGVADIQQHVATVKYVPLRPSHGPS